MAPCHKCGGTLTQDRDPDSPYLFKCLNCGCQTNADEPARSSAGAPGPAVTPTKEPEMKGWTPSRRAKFAATMAAKRGRTSAPPHDKPKRGRPPRAIPVATPRTNGAGRSPGLTAALDAIDTELASLDLRRDRLLAAREPIAQLVAGAEARG